eukprot:984666_1
MSDQELLGGVSANQRRNAESNANAMLQTLPLNENSGNNEHVSPVSPVKAFYEKEKKQNAPILAHLKQLFPGTDHEEEDIIDVDFLLKILALQQRAINILDAECTSAFKSTDGARLYKNLETIQEAIKFAASIPNDHVIQMKIADYIIKYQKPWMLGDFQTINANSDLFKTLETRINQISDNHASSNIDFYILSLYDLIHDILYSLWIITT